MIECAATRYYMQYLSFVCEALLKYLQTLYACLNGIPVLIAVFLASLYRVFKGLQIEQR